jgi:hypothetical protein
MSSLQHQLHQLQASCTLFEQQQQAASNSTTAVASSQHKLDQRMQQLEQQGQRQAGSSRAADSAVAERLHLLEQQVACLTESTAENQVSMTNGGSLSGFCRCCSCMKMGKNTVSYKSCAGHA